MATAPPRNLGRLSEIAQVAARHGFGYLFENRRLRRRELVEGTPSQRGAHLRAMLDELGLVTRDEWDELELRVAQLEHRLRLVEDPPKPDRP